nr:hypothetical protein [uncultured Rhodopila sp.]
MPNITTPVVTDPISVVYRAIWNTLEAFPAWTALVPPGNQLRYDTSMPFVPKQPIPNMVSDSPQVAIVQRAFRMSVGRNSAAVDIEQEFPIYIVSKDMGSIGINQLKWQTFRALFAGNATLGTTGILRQWMLTNTADDGFADSMWKKTRKVWQSVVSVQCQIYVPNANVVSGVLPNQ